MAAGNRVDRDKTGAEPPRRALENMCADPVARGRHASEGRFFGGERHSISLYRAGKSLSTRFIAQPCVFVVILPRTGVHCPTPRARRFSVALIKMFNLLLNSHR